MKQRKNRSEQRWARTLGRVAVLVALSAVAQAWHPSGASAQDEGDQTLFERESEYNHVIVTQEGDLRVMHFRRRRVMYRETVLDTSDPHRLVNEYTRLMMAGLIFVPEPRRILMVGLGGGIVTQTIAHYYPDATIDNVELDPVVVEAARRFFGFRTSGRMRVHVRDGRVWLRSTRQRYDMIILDAYRGGYIPFHLKTREFLELVRDHLTPGGVVVGNLHGGTRLYDADRATYDAVFAQTYPFIGRIDANVIVVGQRSETRLARAQIESRAAQLQRIHAFAFDLPAQVAYYEPRDRYDRRARILTDDHAPVEALHERER